MYPKATEKEWKTKNNVERTVHVLQLKDPNIDPSEFYMQKAIASDDESETDDESINRGNFSFKINSMQINQLGCECHCRILGRITGSDWNFYFTPNLPLYKV